MAKTYLYTEGNTVRKAVSEAEYIEEQRIRHERVINRRKQHKAAQDKAYKTSVAYTVYMTIAIIVMVVCFIGYVSVQANVSASMSKIASLETQISDLKADNLAATNRINSTANLNAVKQAAVYELGMVYATKDQIVYYSVSENDYIEQYDSVK